MLTLDYLKKYYSGQSRLRKDISSIVGILECDEYLDKICSSTVYNYQRVYDLLSSKILSWGEMKDRIIKENK